LILCVANTWLWPFLVINYVGLAKTPQHAGDDYFEIYE
jgi:hypothetical protein